MSEVAREALLKVLRQLENAACRGGRDLPPSDVSRRQTRLLLSPASFPAYQRIRVLADKVACNASLQLAERAGAITIEWDLRSDDKTHILAVEALDGEALASHLGLVPRWVQLRDARHTLESALSRHPLLEEVLVAWSEDGAPRRTRLGAASCRDWLDACRVVDWARSRNSEVLEDVALRRLSTQLFGDSKRLEDIAGLVDAVARGSVAGPVTEPEELFKTLGITKYPSPFLVAAPGLVLYCKDREVACPRPYVGVAGSSITAFRLDSGRDANPIVLTVENLTSFHEMTALVPANGILLYTGGMPSPAWLRTYRVLLDGLPASARLFHWGDVDGGGFRIAHVLATSCRRAERSLTLHLMALHDDGVVKRPMERVEFAQVESICREWGWAEALSACDARRAAIEQESVAPSFPDPFS